MKALLVVFCSGGCEASIKLGFPIANHNKLQKRVVAQGWFLSVLTAPGQGNKVPLDFAPTCPKCARQEMPHLFNTDGTLKVPPRPS